MSSNFFTRFSVRILETFGTEEAKLCPFMLETLISSKTRIKLLLKFFLNSESKGYLRSLAHEFGDSTNAIRVELNKFEEAGMLKSELDGNKKVFMANRKHPLFDNLHAMVMKYIGIDKIVENISIRLGDIQKVYLVGDYAEGRDSGIIDLFILASDLDALYLMKLLQKAEAKIDRKIRYVHFEVEQELLSLLNNQANLLIWEK